MRLDPATHYHRGDPDTSRAAAEAALTEQKVSACQRRVMSAYNAHRHSGICGHEIERLLPEWGHSARARATDLKQEGLLEDTGRRRESPRGAAAAVLCITQAGIDWCARWQVDEWVGPRVSELDTAAAEAATAVRLAGECPLCGGQFIGRPGLNRHLYRTHKAVT